jgi:NAD(P)-dependent dehydrogenase (short-subunit alcohol dehydrogenase family)
MKKIILTGSASGFGLLAVKTLASKGHTVYATMRNVNGANAIPAQEIKQWAKDNNANVEVVELDVTSDASAKNAIAEITKHSGGQIDVLINNAGISFIGVNESISAEQTDQVFQVNVIGADRMIKAVLPFMHKQKDGLIVNVTRHYCQRIKSQQPGCRSILWGKNAQDEGYIDPILYPER